MQIETTEAAESALGSASFLLFKHSHRCGVSARAFAQYEQFLAAHEIDTGWINVVDDREISLWVAEHSGIEHKSPQALLIRDGEVIWHASHFKITSESLATAIRA